MSAPVSAMAAVRGPVLAAAAVFAAFFGGLGTWASLAPLSSAAVAPGVVGVETRRKTVQHLEGGIIHTLAVRDGDRVRAGDVLIRLDDTVARSTLELLQGQYVDLVAEQARIHAERADAPTIAFPPQLLSPSAGDRARQSMVTQRNVFEARRLSMQSKVEILNRRVLETEEQIVGFHVQKEALSKQLVLIEQETADLEIAVRKGIEPKARMLSLKREGARIEGLVGEITSRTAQARLRIGETRLEIVDLRTRLVDQLTADLRALDARIGDMLPRLRAARDALERVEVRSPESGTVVGMRFHTVGGVVPPGGAILDIVPSSVAFLIEANVSPSDIDVVRPGLKAEVRLTAFSARNTPTLAGRVIFVSADRLAEQASGQTYYAIRVRLDPDQADAFDLTQLYPGMPVEVMVVTGEQTALAYLLSPINQTLARAFREQ